MGNGFITLKPKMQKNGDAKMIFSNFSFPYNDFYNSKFLLKATAGTKWVNPY